MPPTYEPQFYLLSKYAFLEALGVVYFAGLLPCLIFITVCVSINVLYTITGYAELAKFRDILSFYILALCWPIGILVIVVDALFNEIECWLDCNKEKVAVFIIEEAKRR